MNTTQYQLGPDDLDGTSEDAFEEQDEGNDDLDQEEDHVESPAAVVVIVGGDADDDNEDTVDTDDESTESFDRIGALPGVMSVAMVYHHLEPEQEQESQDGTDAT